MAYEYGNLARPLPAIEPRRVEERRRREETRERLIVERRVRLAWRAIVRSRLRLILSLISFVFVATALVLVPVLRDARIVEANYANVGLENEIRELRKDNTIRESQLLRINDLAVIERYARQNLCLQDKAADQELVLTVSSGERLLRNGSSTVDPVATIESYIHERR